MSTENGLLEALEIAVESTDVAVVERTGNGFPELTALGKRIEMLRIERGLSKQALARGAATSRQQLWRVMTGKSELTGTLGQRLAEILQVDARALRTVEGGGAQTWSSASAAVVTFDAAPSAPRTFAEFVADATQLQRALATLPDDAEGQLLRRRLLDAVHEIAAGAGLPLDPSLLSLRAAAVTIA
jgi:transcriptional regulator with XRE-family HTH domain